MKQTVQEIIKELFGVSFLQVSWKLWETAHRNKLEVGRCRGGAENQGRWYSSQI